MDFAPSARAAELTELVGAFVRDEIEPVAAEYHRQVSESAASGEWKESPILGELRQKARGRGLMDPLESIPLRIEGGLPILAPTAAGLFVAGMTPFDGFVAAVATFGAPPMLRFFRFPDWNASS